jgi:hypothetical protein
MDEKEERRKWDKHHVHWVLYDRDYRAMNTYKARMGFSSIADAIHSLEEIKRNQPPGKLNL